MKVCILSDSHDHIPLLRAAAEDAVKLGAEAILHCGDVVAPSTLNCLNKIDNPIPVHVIHGNNTGDLVALTRNSTHPDSVIRYHGQDAGVVLDGKRIFIVHYPHYAKAMALTGDWDIVCCGHSHKVELETITNIEGHKTFYVNPGTIGGVGTSPATWILADLETMTFETHEVDKAIEFNQPKAQVS